MKRFTIAILMLVIAGIFCWCEIHHVNTNAESYTNRLETVQRLMKSKDFGEASLLSENILLSWEKASRQMDKYLYHDYIDDITRNMALLPIHTKSGDITAVNSQIESIKIQLTSLKESELPYFHNIL